MGRTAFLSVILALAVGLAAVSPALGEPAPPRGVLTKVEFREFEASFQALTHGKARGTPTHVARRSCRALTNATRLTAAEHAECEASVIFTIRFFEFPYVAAQCQKRPTDAGKLRCVLGAVTTFKTAVSAFIRTNAASVRAAAPRGFTRRCLDYLIFTRPQATTTTALKHGLQRYARAIRLGSVGALTSAATRLNSDMVASRQAMSINITPSACSHE